MMPVEQGQPVLNHEFEYAASIASTLHARLNLRSQSSKYKKPFHIPEPHCVGQLGAATSFGDAVIASPLLLCLRIGFWG
jgi:hypothetical protein